MNLTARVRLISGSTIYRYTDTADSQEYGPRLLSLQTRTALPLPDAQRLSERTATVELDQHIRPSLTAIAPTISELLQSGISVVGLPAVAELFDTDTNSVYEQINGFVRSINRIDESRARLTISEDLLGEVRSLLPGLTFRAMTEVDDRTAIAVILGVARKVRLYPLRTQQLSGGEIVQFWGPLRPAASGALSIQAVYRDGGIIPSSEYDTRPHTFDHNGVSVAAIRLDGDQRRANGNWPEIAADLDSTEFQRDAALAVRFLLADTTYGLGLDAPTASYQAARATYSAAGLFIAGALTEQEAAGDLLPQLMPVGSRIIRNADGGLEIAVNITAPQAPDDVGLGTTDDYWKNMTVRPAALPRAERRLRKFTVWGLPDPGFAGGETWLAHSIRHRSLPRASDTDLYLRYTGDTDTLDRHAHWAWHEFLASESPLIVRISPQYNEARLMQLGSRVPIWAPNLGLSNVEHLIHQIVATTDGIELTLWPYRPEIYVYAVGTNRVSDPRADFPIDYSRTIPQKPDNLTATANTAEALPDNREEVTISAQADAPAENVEALVFYLVRTGGDAIRAEQVVPCEPGQTGLTASLLADPHIRYTVACYARNEANEPGFQIGEVAQVEVESLGDPGRDGQAGPRGLTGYTHLIRLQSYQPTPAAVNTNGEWHLDGGENTA